MKRQAQKKKKAQKTRPAKKEESKRKAEKKRDLKSIDLFQSQQVGPEVALFIQNLTQEEYEQQSEQKAGKPLKKRRE